MGAFTETFTGTNGTALNGRTSTTGGVTCVSNGATISSNHALCAGNVYALWDCGSADHEIEVELAATGSNACLLFGIDASGNGYGLYTLSNYIHLIRVDTYSTAGQDPLSQGSGTSTSDAITLGAGDFFKVNRNGTTLTVSRKASGAGSYTQLMQRTGVSTATGSRAGFARLGGGGSPEFDNLSVTPIVVASMAIDRNNVLAGNGTNVTLTLTGTNTAWDGTTVFTPTNLPTGWTKDSQNVTSATAATITLARGSGTSNTITITESVTGTTSDTVVVTNTATSAGAGAWSTAATWDVLEMPAATNNATVAHAVTVSGSRSISVLTVNASGTVTVQDGATLTIKANSVLANGVLQVGETTGGATLNIDGGAKVTMGSAANQTSTLLKSRGNGSDRSVIRTTSGTTGSGNAYFDGSDSDSQWIDLEDLDLIDVGDDDTPAILISSDDAAGENRIKRVIASATCGDIKFAGTLNASLGLVVENFTHKNPSTPGLYVTGTATPVAVTRTLIDPVFYGTPRLAVKGLTISGPIYHKGYGDPAGTGRTTSHTDIFLRTWTDVTVPSAGAGARDGGSCTVNRLGDWDNVYFCADGGDYDGNGRYTSHGYVLNTHWTSPKGAPAGNYVVSDIIVESWGTAGDSNGDGTFAPNTTGDVDYSPSDTNTSEWEFVLGIPYEQLDNNVGSPGCLTTITNTPESTGNKFRHWTWYCGGQGVIHLGESSATAADMVTEAWSGISWNLAGVEDTGAFNAHICPSNPVFIADPSLMVADAVSSGAADYNVRFHLNDLKNFAGAPAYHYKRGGGSTVPGAHDLEVDPGFVDTTRRFWTWVRDELIGSGTIPAPASGGSPLTPDTSTETGRRDFCAWGLYLLSLKNEPWHADYNADATLANLKTYLAGGFAPTNVLLQNSGHDSVTRGAVEGVFGGAIPVFRHHYAMQGMC